MMMWRGKNESMYSTSFLQKLAASTFRNPARLFVLGFGLLILLGSILLSLPISTASGKGLPYVDALFTATSAVCVTGLVVVDTGTTFSLFGKIVIMLLIQIGGLGFMTMATLFSLILGRKITFRERVIIQESFNHATLEGIVKLVQRVLLYTFVLEGIGALLLALYWLPSMGWKKALFFGIFHSISSFNNAGFDILGNFQSLTPYVSDPYINLVVISLVILGGLGFFVLSELFHFRFRKRLSLHTKVVLMTSMTLLIAGAVFIFLFEYTNPKTLGSLDWAGKVLAPIFQSTVARTQGMNTLPIGDMRQATLLILILLMFIGASPGSTGGGVKTTTFMVLVGAVWSMIQGKRDVVFFKQRLPERLIFRALSVTLISFLLVFSTSILLSMTERADFLTILFESTSAFGTVGLSMGLTPHLTVFGKLILSFTMFAGRVGPLTFALALILRRREEHFRYNEGKVMIG
ncbi:TrkH family potassium uptake protein [Thermicanus aegyptius]|uniref:TrkH family potassium uptake protein n=1 Tax=Thermicanus aegyptius TaxID=94009 RepID=UPI00316AD963